MMEINKNVSIIVSPYMTVVSCISTAVYYLFRSGIALYCYFICLSIG